LDHDEEDSHSLLNDRTTPQVTDGHYPDQKFVITGEFKGHHFIFEYFVVSGSPIEKIYILMRGVNDGYPVMYRREGGLIFMIEESKDQVCYREGTSKSELFERLDCIVSDLYLNKDIKRLKEEWKRMQQNTDNTSKIDS